MRTLTTNEQAVLDFLVKNNGWHSPTKIGGIVGGKTCSGRERHSAWACPILKRLVEKGYAVRGETGIREGLYMASSKAGDSCER